MAVADLIILATVIISMLFGAWRGLVKEALSLAFWIGAVVLAGMFNDMLAVKLGFVTNPALQRVAAFVIIFVVVVFVGGLISNLISKLTSAVGLKAADRGLGAIFGVVRGVIIVTLVLILTSPFEQVRIHYADSMTVPYLMQLADYIQGWLGLGAAAPAATAA